MDVFTSDEASLFTEIYGNRSGRILLSLSYLLSLCLSLWLETILTKRAYSNSCLLITFYTRSDLDEVNTLTSPERQRLLEEFRSNEKLNQILDYFENRILFVDIRQEEDLNEYSVGGLRYLRYRTVNELINERKQIVYKHLSKFIEYFFPGKQVRTSRCSVSITCRSSRKIWLWKSEMYEGHSLEKWFLREASGRIPRYRVRRGRRKSYLGSLQHSTLHANHEYVCRCSR